MNSRRNWTRLGWVQRGLVVALAVVALAATAVPSANAADDPNQGGLWYFTLPRVEAAQQRATGTGITVAVIDGALNPAAPDLVGTTVTSYPESFCANSDGTRVAGTSTAEDAEHGTHMVSLIIGTGVGASGQPGVRGIAPGATVRHYNTHTTDWQSTECKAISPGVGGRGAAIAQAVADGAQIISISLNSATTEALELSAIASAERAGVIIVAGPPNAAGTDLGWPAGANGVISAEAADVNGKLTADTVTSPTLGIVAPGVAIRVNRWSGGAWNTFGLTVGTSDATAWTSGALALVWSAYPNATANQMIQTLLRNTTTGKGELARNDQYGFGMVSVTNMLTVDPTTYPDVNPLLLDSPSARPAYADAMPLPAPTAGPTGAGTQPATAAPGQAPDAITPTADTPLVPILAGAGVLVLLLAVGTTVAVRRNRALASSPPHPNPENGLT